MTRSSVADQDKHIRKAVQRFVSVSQNSAKASTYLESADSKHKTIVGDANIVDICYSNLKGWRRQSDVGSPPYLSWRKIRDLGFRGVVDYGIETYRSIRHYKWQGYYDDLNLIKKLSYDYILKECPVHEVIGRTEYSFHRLGSHTITANTRWLRYVYFSGKIFDQELLASDDPTWIDIGSYYGGLQYIVNKMSKSPIRNILVDFEHQLCRSFAVLSFHFPSSMHCMVTDDCKYVDLMSNEIVQTIPKGKSCFIYCPAHLFSYIDRLIDGRPDLVSNFFSLGEMRREHFIQYVESRVYKTAKAQFLVNRFISAPFFEPTYDTDITIADYLDSVKREKIRDFDVCGIHHYNTVVRDFCGKKAPRPVSSSYFQLIAKE